MQALLSRLQVSISRKDTLTMLNTLMDRTLKLEGIKETHRDWYYLVLEENFPTLLKVIDNSLIGQHLDVIPVRRSLQDYVNIANEYALKEAALHQALKVLNVQLKTDNVSAFWEAFTDPRLCMPVHDLPPEASALYHAELKQDMLSQVGYGGGLSQEQIITALPRLRHLVLINAAVERIESETLWKLLSNHSSAFIELPVHQESISLYLEKLKSAKHCKEARGNRNGLLTLSEVKAVIAHCNDKNDPNKRKMCYLRELDDALHQHSLMDCFQILLDLQLTENILEGNRDLYYRLLLREKRILRRQQHPQQSPPPKAPSSNSKPPPASILSLKDVENVIQVSNGIAKLARELGHLLNRVNQLLANATVPGIAKDQELYSLLQNPILGLHHMNPQCQQLYYRRLLDVRNFKLSEEGLSLSATAAAATATAATRANGWLSTRTTDNYHFMFYYNILDGRLVWSKCDDKASRGVSMDCDPGLLNHEEIQAIIGKVNEEFELNTRYVGHDMTIVQMQALIRGYLVRRQYRQRWDLFSKQYLVHICRIQRWWRVCRVRLHTHYWQLHAKALVQLQALVRGWLQRRRYRRRLAYFDTLQVEIVRIQAHWRGFAVRRLYRLLRNPSTSIATFVYLRRFVRYLFHPQLDSNAALKDYTRQAELYMLQQSLHSRIRQSVQTEKCLREMDEKIGLLVKNQMQLTAAKEHHHGGSIKKRPNNTPLADSSEDGSTCKGVSPLIAGDHSNQAKWQEFFCTTGTEYPSQRVAAYEELLHQLITHPTLLSAILLSASKDMHSSLALDLSTLLALFHQLQTSRDQYLMLRLLEVVTRSQLKFYPPHHTAADTLLLNNLLSVQVLSSLCVCNSATCSTSTKGMRELLYTSVSCVTDPACSSTPVIVNPVDIYLLWMSEKRNNCNNSTTTTPDTTFPHVNAQEALKHDEVRMRFHESMKTLIYFASNIVESIVSQVNQVPIMVRHICCLLYHALKQKYPTMSEKECKKNVCSVLFGRYFTCLLRNPDKHEMISTLSEYSRKNFATICKILCAASANKGYGPERAYLGNTLNPFIRSMHTKLREYIGHVMQVQPMEQAYSLDDIAASLSFIEEPCVLTLTANQLRCVHALMQQDCHPELHHVLTQCGPLPTTQLSKTDLQLSLHVHHCVSSQLSCDHKDDQLLQVKCHCLLFVCDNSLTDGDLCATLWLATDGTLQSLVSEMQSQGRLPSQERDLESRVVSMVLQDVRNRGAFGLHYRQQLPRLECLLKQIDTTLERQHQRMDAFINYEHACLNKMHPIGRLGSAALDSTSCSPSLNGIVTGGGGGVGGIGGAAGVVAGTMGSRSGIVKGKKRPAFTCTATVNELKKKGIVDWLGLEKGKSKQLKVRLTASDTEPGLFEITLLLKSTVLAEQQVRFSDLLKKQFDRIQQLTLWEKATFNLPLLVQFINKKFYE